MNHINDQKSPYAPMGHHKSSGSSLLADNKAAGSSHFLGVIAAVFLRLWKLRSVLLACLILLLSSYLGMRLMIGGLGSLSSAGVLIILLGLLLSVFILLHFFGSQLSQYLPLHNNDSPLSVAWSWLQGRLKIEEVRRGPPAPELALSQFVSQVRSYASEKSFQNAKPSADRSGASGTLHSESANLLKRRWNEVVDSLDEFEIYLANDPQGMISKLVNKNPPKLIDAAVVFREVAETFDTTWRRKGINIESAIVTPLKATAHEGLLRRLLVGPWRASAYFARRGSGVVFSAKSVNGRVIARWEVDGLSIPDDYLQCVNDSSKPVNERIEKGLTVLAPDPSNSPNTLYALISLITWVDLAQACASEFEFKNNNSGFVIELRLK